MEKGAICLKVTYFILQWLDGATICYNMEDSEVDVVYDSDWIETEIPNQGPGLPRQIVEEFNANHGMVQTAGPGLMEEDSEDEMEDTVEILLQNVELERMQGQLQGMQFVRLLTQERMEEMAPNYQNW